MDDRLVGLHAPALNADAGDRPAVPRSGRLRAAGREVSTRRHSDCPQSDEHGLPTVTVTGVKLVIRRAGGESVVPFEWITQSPSPLPIRLGPGDTWLGMIHAASVKEGIDRQRGQGPRWQVRAVMSDGADRRFPAKPSGWSRLRPGRRWITF